MTFGAAPTPAEADKMRIVWISLIIVLFGVGMFFLRRYMQR